MLESGPTPFDPDTGLFVREPIWDDLPEWGDEDLSWDLARRVKWEIQRDYWYMKRHALFYEWWERGVETGASRVLKRGEILRTEGATLRVMHTPGHAENHASFVLEEEQSIFSGDHVLGFGTTVVSDLHDYMLSLHQLLEVKPNRLYPGHGPHIEDGSGLLTRYNAHRFQREAQIVELLEEHWRERSGEDNIAEGTTALQIAASLYVDTPLDRIQQAKENVEKVMVKLWKEGRLAAIAAEGDGEADVKMNVNYSGPINLPEKLLWTPRARFYEHPALVAAGTAAPGGIRTAEIAGGGEDGAEEDAVASKL